MKIFLGRQKRNRLGGFDEEQLLMKNSCCKLSQRNDFLIALTKLETEL